MEKNESLTLIEAFLDAHDVVSGHMFGMPCLKVHNKVFAVAFESGVVFKLPADARADALKMPGTQLWAPFSETHVKKEWVYFADVQEEHLKSFTNQAANYVAQLALQSK